VPAWHSLGMCDHTGDQSPIDIVTSKVEEAAFLRALELTPGVANSQGELVLNEHTWQVNLPNADAGITWHGEFYKLAQFHFHSPSENTVDGRHYDMEMHLVHSAGPGKSLVVAYLLDAKTGSSNPFLASFWNGFPKTEGERPTKGVAAPYSSAGFHCKPAPSGAYYSFMGSFTTPPCTNGTQWIVMKDPVHISPDQLSAYRHGIQEAVCTQLAVQHSTPQGVYTPWDGSLGTNNRPTQPVGERSVSEFIPSSPGQASQWNMTEDPWVRGIAALAVALIVVAVAMKMRGKRPAEDYQTMPQ